MDLAFILVVICQALVSSAWPELHFSDDQTFHITIFEDLHFGEGPDTDWGPRHDANTLKVMKRVLEDESPELVVLNGDLITGADTFKENSTDYVDMIVAPIVEAGLPWASTYGSELSTESLPSFNSLTELFVAQTMTPISICPEKTFTPGKRPMKIV